MAAINRSSKMVATWLLIGVGMTVVQIALGGITRLTGSGLSITEWEVVTGTIPPLNDTEWLQAFNKYQQTSQFKFLNFEFELKDFKFIFFWEWFHRLWARLIGLIFAIGFVGFSVKKYFKKEMIPSLVVLFCLGALQGMVGWIMVASGLTGDMVYVKPTRLALHFILALVLLCYTYWFALQLLVPKEQQVVHAKARRTNILLLVLLFVQLLYGALMAGHKAANIAATWPTINGQWIPDSLFHSNTVSIHFIHRGLAYILLVVIIIFTLQLSAINGSKLFNRFKNWPLIIVLAQIVLGIASVLSSSGIIPGHWGLFEWMSQIHQLVGIALLLALVTMFFLVQRKAQ